MHLYAAEYDEEEHLAELRADQEVSAIEQQQYKNIHKLRDTRTPIPRNAKIIDVDENANDFVSDDNDDNDDDYVEDVTPNHA